MKPPPTASPRSLEILDLTFRGMARTRSPLGRVAMFVGGVFLLAEEAHRSKISQPTELPQERDCGWLERA